MKEFGRTTKTVNSENSRRIPDAVSGIIRGRIPEGIPAEILKEI